VRLSQALAAGISVNDHRYKYKAERVVKAGDLDFIVDTRMFAHYF